MIKAFISLIFILFGLNAFSQIVINEIMINPSGANDGANTPNSSEWIELYNTTGSAVDIGCWVFSDGDFAVTFPSGTSISAFGYFTIASASGSGLSPSLDWATCGCTSGPASQVGLFVNGSEQIVLYSDENVLIDAIIWTGGQTLPDTLATTAQVGCSSLSVILPLASSGVYENIGGGGADGIPRERSVDGGATWQAAPVDGTFGYNNASALPIELLSFNAICNETTVKLNWSTATETNNNYFTVEKTINGETFEEILKLQGAGNSSQINTYEAKDLNPTTGISYYRLRQTDFDGKTEFFDLVSVYCDDAIPSSASLYPNPGSTFTTLKYNSERNDIVKVEVLNIYGQTVKVFLLNTSKGTHDYQIDISLLSTGSYILMLAEMQGFGPKIKRLKLIKQ